MNSGEDEGLSRSYSTGVNTVTSNKLHKNFPSSIFEPSIRNETELSGMYSYMPLSNSISNNCEIPVDFKMRKIPNFKVMVADLPLLPYSSIKKSETILEGDSPG